MELIKKGGSGSSPVMNADWTPQGVTLVTVGGIPSGTNLGTAATPIDTTLDQMFYPYQAPLVNSVVLSPAAGYKKIGTSIVAPTITPTVTVRTNPITHLTVTATGGSAYTNTRTPPPAITTGAQTAWTDPATVTATTTYTVTDDDAPVGAGTGSSSAAYTFIHPYYYGTGPAALDAAGIVATLTEVILPMADVTYPFTLTAPNVRAYMVYPNTTADLKAIKGVQDANGFDVTPDFSLGGSPGTPARTVTISGQTYKVYELEHDAFGGATTYTFDVI